MRRTLETLTIVIHQQKTHTNSQPERPNPEPRIIMNRKIKEFLRGINKSANSLYSSKYAVAMLLIFLLAKPSMYSQKKSDEQEIYDQSPCPVTSADSEGYSATNTLRGKLPAWAGQVFGTDDLRIAVLPPGNPRFEHLAWPKAVVTEDGIIVLGYQAGTHHGDHSCPAVSISKDGGKTFTQPHILKEFGPDQDYSNSGNMAMGLAHDGSVIILSHGHTGNETNHIFGWRSTDSGHTWDRVDTSALGPNRTGSSTGSIVRLPDKKLMVVGHYRGGSSPYTSGIWQSISNDDGLTWGTPSMINNLNAGEPVLVRNGNRLIVFIRGRGQAATRQFLSISDDWGKTWRTELSTIKPVNMHTTGLAHPFAMVNPYNSNELLAVTFERPLPGSAQLWRGDAQTLNFTHDRTLIELPKIDGDPHTDFGYGWMVALQDHRALLFFYHGKRSGSCPIWVIETKI